MLSNQIKIVLRIFTHAKYHSKYSLYQLDYNYYIQQNHVKLTLKAAASAPTCKDPSIRKLIIWSKNSLKFAYEIYKKNRNN